MKTFAKIVTISMITLGLLGPNFVFSAADSRPTVNSTGEMKVYSNATLEDNFAEDRVLVMLSNETSLKFNDYSTSDFPEVKCKDVYDFSKAMRSQIQEKVEIVRAAAALNTLSSLSLDMGDVDRYNQILCLSLENPGKSNVLSAVKELEKRDDVISVEPDYEISLCSAEINDTYYSEQWALSKIQIEEAWGITTGSANVKVGILDTGIDGEHPDLQGRVHVYDSWDFTLGDYEGVCVIPTDRNGHGTFVAGIIAATCDNAVGIAGACQNVTLASLRVLKENGHGYSSYLAKAIEYAYYNHISILNLSAGWYMDSIEYNTVLEGIIENYGGLFICSAGNNSLNIDNAPCYPSSYNLYNLISVAASTENDTCRYDSNFGPINVDLFAPGEGIISCYPTQMCENGTHDIIDMACTSDGYHIANGTSFATPYVTAVAALMLSECPGLTPYQIKTKLLSSADQLSTLEGLCVSGGRLNAYKAVQNLHDLQYSAQDAFSHTVSCVCDINNTEAHTWVKFGTKFRCKFCGYISAIISDGGVYSS